MDDNLVRDIFGDLVTLPSGKRGRPAHVWTKSNGDRVILGLAMGYSDAQIAAGLRISLPTLRKYYFSELKRRDMQKAAFDLWQIHQLATLANDGNVAALKELGKRSDKRDRDRALAAMSDGPVQQPIVGKKAQARQAASDAMDDGGWGGLLGPRGSRH